MSVFGTYSRYYDLLYRDKDYVGETGYVQSLIRKHLPSAETVLDLGCGTGRHDFILSERGYTVTGVDRSEEMLAIATTEKANQEELLATAGGSAIPLPEFHLGDIRKVRFDRKFDAVISLFHVMSYQTGNDDLADAIATVREHLKPGGIFIFDCWYGPGVLTDSPTVRVKRLEDEEIELIRITEPVMHPNDNLVELSFQVLIRDKASGAMEELNEIHRMRYLFRPEIELFLQQRGLTVLESLEWMTDRAPQLGTWSACFVVQG